MVAPLLVGDLFRNCARAVPGRVAVVRGEDALTFGGLDRLANGSRAVLDAHGVAPGDRVVLWAGTRLEGVVAFAAAAKAGAVFVPVNPALGADEAEPIVRIARPAAIVADGECLEAASSLGAGLGVPVIPLDEMVGAERDDDPDVALAEDAPHVVFFTSGSTGRPKGAVLSHRVNLLRTHPGAQFEPRGAAVCMFPLFHMAGWTIGMQQWQARDVLVLPESTEPAALAAAVREHSATRMNCIPLVWRRILDAMDAGAIHRDELRSLRFADTGTSATPLELLHRLRRALPAATVRVFYGSTEAGNVMTLEQADFDAKPGSVGVPSIHTRTRLRESGELEVAGPLLFDGYLDDAAATAAALVDGWYRTGDLAEIDGEGYVSIVGRATTLIRTGGESVVPAEVESVLQTHPRVADVAVVGVADADYGEIVVAVLVPVAGDGPLPELGTLRSFASERLAAYKLPRRVEWVDSLPRTAATGQVQRHLVVEGLMP